MYGDFYEKWIQADCLSMKVIQKHGMYFNQVTFRHSAMELTLYVPSQSLAGLSQLNLISPFLQLGPHSGAPKLHCRPFIKLSNLLGSLNLRFFKSCEDVNGLFILSLGRCRSPSRQRLHLAEESSSQRNITQPIKCTPTGSTVTILRKVYCIVFSRCKVSVIYFF